MPASSGFPRFVQIQTNNKCNAACTFCPYPYTEGKAKFQLMDWDLYTKIIDECAKHGVEQILPFFFNEPLLNKDLVKYIRYAKEKNPRAITKIFTNGSLFTKERSKEILDSGIDQVIFSFNGSTREEYERLMKPLKFDDVKEKISDFIRMRGSSKKPEIAVHMLKVGPSNDVFFRMRDYWNSLGVAVHILKYENRAGNVEGYDVKSSAKVQKVPCSRLLNQMFIVVNGDVILCCADWKHEVILGNVKKQSIEEVWNGPVRMHYVNKNLARDFKGLKLCDVCNFNEIQVS